VSGSDNKHLATGIQSATHRGLIMKTCHFILDHMIPIVLGVHFTLCNVYFIELFRAYYQ